MAAGTESNPQQHACGHGPRVRDRLNAACGFWQLLDKDVFRLELVLNENGQTLDNRFDSTYTESNCLGSIIDYD